MRGSLAFAAVLGLTAAASPANAQQSPRKIDLGLQAKVTHDTNVARANEALAAERGLVQEDTLASPTATAVIVLPFGRQSFYLNALAGYDFYQENHKLDSERINIESGVRLSVGACGANLNGTYRRAQSELQLLSIAGAKNTLETQRGGFSLNCGRASGFSAGISGDQENSRNSNLLQEQVDSDSTSYQGSLIYQRPTFGVLTVFASYNKIDYPHRSAVTAANSGYESKGVGLSFERRLGARIEGKVTVTQNETTPAINVVGFPAKFSSLLYSGEITFRPSSRIDASISYDRSVKPSISLTRLYDVSETTAAQLHYKLGSRITLSLGGQIADMESASALVFNPRDLTQARTELVYGAAEFAPSRRLRFRLDVSNEERNTNNPRFDYKSSRVGLTTNVDF